MLRKLARTATDVVEASLQPLGLVADELPEQRRTLGSTKHRPWPLPQRPWLLGQTWNDLLFAHWSLRPELLRPLVPTPLEVDLYEGEAWLGITPFLISGARARGMPPLPWLSRFPELNVRTYVSFGGRSGIYFFSLDAARRAAVAAARRAYRLPYFQADMEYDREGREIHYRSQRMDPTGPGAEFRASYRPSGPLLPIEAGRIERWLAERYCLYVVDEQHHVLRGEIHHRPWPLQPATAAIHLNTMTRPLGLRLEGSPLLHYSARQDTLIWSLERV
jgi:uncharacterized protein YqjF (DUF2071 family)